MLGEKLYGKAQAFKNIVGITLGTGFGSGIVVDHKLYSGTLSSAGEFGGVPYLDKTIEDYCSGKFFWREFGLSGHEVAARAANNDAQALEILNQFGAHIGNAIKIILYAVSPEAIFLGGSVSECYPFFAAAMHQSIADFPFERVRNRLLIERSAINNVALLGAAALVQMNIK